MRLYGRVTLSGEYLLGMGVPGVMLRSNLSLTDEPDGSPACERYDRAMDGVARELLARGFPTAWQIHGDLPLGYGLGGSTILAFLHLNTEGISAARRASIITSTDASCHGFEPSGLDLACCLHQEHGVYHKDSWTSVTVTPFAYCLALFAKEKRKELRQVREVMLDHRTDLALLAQRVRQAAEQGTLFEHSALLEYCRYLASLDVYSTVAKGFIESLLRKGVAAKGTGGLYDKAVIVLGRRSACQGNAREYGVLDLIEDSTEAAH